MSPEVLADAVPWLEAAAAEVDDLPPPGVAVDVGRLLTRRGWSHSRDIRDSSHVFPPRLRSALAAYEEYFLGRLMADRHFDAARDALDRLRTQEPRETATAIAVLLALVLERLPRKETGGASGPLLRRLARRPAADVLNQGWQVLGSSEVHADELAAAYEALTQAARRSSRLIGGGEVLVLENLAALRGAAPRLALRQIADAADAVERPLPARLVSRRQRGAVATRLDDESSYPIGGYSSISTTGPIESLVSSELVYLDREAEIDPFQVRWAAGELLKYTRDESVFSRLQRRVTFFVSADLERCRVKSPGLPWQRLVLVLGLLLAAVRRLHRWLDEVALDIRIVFGAGLHGRDPLAHEAELCRLLLREWIERGTVTVSRAAVQEFWALQAEEQSVPGAAENDVVLFSSDPAELLLEEIPPAVQPLSFAGPRPVLGLQTIDGEGEAAESRPVDISVWSKTLLELLRILV